MAKVSKELVIALKLNEKPAYQIAQLAKVNPNTLSRLINGIDPVRPGDFRVLAVGAVLGVPQGRCFEDPAEAKANEQ
jgi:hypothetical protein